jgi:hypothetical protein
MQAMLRWRQDGRIDLKVIAGAVRFTPRLSLSDLALSCVGATLDQEHITCPHALLTARHPLLGRVHSRLAFRYRFANGAAKVEATRLTVAGGRGRLSGEWQRPHWVLNLDLLDLDITKLTPLFKHVPRPAGNPIGGLLDLKAEIRGRGVYLHHLRITARMRRLRVNGGAALPMPVTLMVRADRDKRGGWWDIGRAQLDHPGVLNLSISGTLALGWIQALPAFHIKAKVLDLKAAYPLYLQPLLPAGLGTIETKGSLEIEIGIEDRNLSDLQLSLRDVFVHDRSGRFWLSAVGGWVKLAPHSTSPVRSRVCWQGGGLYRLPVGAAELTLESVGRTMRLIHGGRLPILDGELRIEGLRMEDLGTRNFSVRLDGILSPVTLADFSRALAWPLLSGKLSGVIPGLYYQNNRLRIGGTLLVQAFDGKIVVHNLRIDELFGPAPRLAADILLKDLELAALTHTFAFGKIEGRLSGSINRLHLEDWQPVYFEAELATPEQDQSRHRISQRAVANLTDLGGGMTTSMISRLMLQLFDEFSYDRLGIKCRLYRGVCEMDGLEPVDGGYAIVKPGLLPPWLEVKGYNRAVDWEVLIARLRALRHSEGARIK